MISSTYICGSLISILSYVPILYLSYPIKGNIQYRQFSFILPVESVWTLMKINLRLVAAFWRLLFATRRLPGCRRVAGIIICLADLSQSDIDCCSQGFLRLWVKSHAPVFKLMIAAWDRLSLQATNYLGIFDITRPEVSKLTPENKRNSQVTKLSPAESSEATNRLTDISENFKPVNKYPRNIFKSLSKVAHLELESF